MDNDNLQHTLSHLMQAGDHANPAYTTLLHDYTRYHTVLFIEASLFALLFIGLIGYCWRQVTHRHHAGPRPWSFEKTTWACLGIGSTVVTLFLLLIVAANLSNVLNPEAGFAQSLPDLSTPLAGTPRAALYQAVNTWVQSGNTDMPLPLQNAVRERLAWQRPKAIIASILLVVVAGFTVRVWQTLFQRRAGDDSWHLREKALLTIGVLALPSTVFLLLMALANTQASFAPIMLTLLFS